MRIGDERQERGEQDNEATARGQMNDALHGNCLQATTSFVVTTLKPLPGVKHGEEAWWWWLGPRHAPCQGTRSAHRQSSTDERQGEGDDKRSEEDRSVGDDGAG